MEKEIFELGENAIKLVITEIKRAEKYIKIVVFQMQNLELIDALIEKVKQKIKVEIITLPFTSIYQADIEEEVNKKFLEFSELGGKLHIYDWNIGTTEHTKTVAGPWYGLHAKFILTEKAAIILSANLTNEPEIDAVIINKDNKMIEKFNESFEGIKENYIEDKIINKIKENYNSNKIIDKGKKKNKDNLAEIFAHQKHLSEKQKSILHYPLTMCKEVTEIKETLYVTPFDCIGRNFIKKIIEEAREFVYICSERFTDEDSFYFLDKTKIAGRDIKVLAKFKSQDYQYKIRKLAKDSIALGIELRDLDIHAKLIITDKLVALGSINFNQMNLGFVPKKGFLRGNTEVIYVCRDKAIIEKAKKVFLELFAKSSNVIDKIAEKEGEEIKKFMKNVLDVKKFKDKKEFIKEYMKDEIETRKKLIEKMVAINNRDIGKDKKL